MLERERKSLSSSQEFLQRQIVEERKLRELQLQAAQQQAAQQAAQQQTASDQVERGVRLALVAQAPSLRLLESCIQRPTAASPIPADQQDRQEFERLVQGLPMGHGLAGTSWRDFVSMDLDDFQTLLTLVTFSERLTLKRLFRAARPDLTF